MLPHSSHACQCNSRVAKIWDWFGGSKKKVLNPSLWESLNLTFSIFWGIYARAPVVGKLVYLPRSDDVYSMDMSNSLDVVFQGARKAKPWNWGVPSCWKFVDLGGSGVLNAHLSLFVFRKHPAFKEPLCGHWLLGRCLGPGWWKFQGKIGVCSNTQQYGPVCPPWQGPRVLRFLIGKFTFSISYRLNGEFRLVSLSSFPNFLPNFAKATASATEIAVPDSVQHFYLKDHPLSKWSGWWFQSFFIFHNIRDNPSHWLIFFKMVKTTNQWLVAGTITQLCVPPSWSTKISLSTVFVQAWQVSPACNSGSDYERICVPGLEDLGEHGRTESAVSRIPHHLGMG